MPAAKHHAISTHLEQAITSGRLGPGARVPSENELAHRFGVSRPTVARAFRDLERKGLVDRRSGSGTYVTGPSLAAQPHTFGLLIPGLGDTEIFEPICAAIASEAQRHGHRLLWGSSAGAGGKLGPAAQAEALCRVYVEQKISGVFFAPVELDEGKDAVNRRILKALDEAGCAVVLLDRDAVAGPARGAHDLVSVDHRRAGHLLGAHLIARGHGRIDFLARPHSAPTMKTRIAGYQEALLDAGIAPRRSWVHFGDPSGVDFVRAVLAKGARAFVCGNDVTAGQLMQTLETLDVRVPRQAAVVGFDDVKYAALLRVPLTTVQQPCADIGVTAVVAMLDRLTYPHLPAREILLAPRLVRRRSCGA